LYIFYEWSWDVALKMDLRMNAAAELVEHEYKVSPGHRAYLAVEEFLSTDIVRFSDLLRLGEVNKFRDVTWACLPTSTVKIEASSTPAGVCFLAL
jgi:hypothetical protein